MTKNNTSSPRKPLGRRSYGSVPHMRGSRVGPGDWHIHDGQAAIACSKARDRHDRVVVTEKVDGSNVGVARIGHDVVPLTRAGYHALDSHFKQHRHFARWVSAREDRFRGLLADGERVAGEWLLQAHGTRYALASAEDLFVAFDILSGRRRAPYDDMASRCREHGVRTAAVVSDGPPFSIEEAMALLCEFGFHGALDPVEGAVWRVERKGQYDFMCKFVRAGKQDGWLLPEVSGGETVWNWNPAEI